MDIKFVCKRIKKKKKFKKTKKGIIFDEYSMVALILKIDLNISVQYIEHT